MNLTLTEKITGIIYTNLTLDIDRYGNITCTDNFVYALDDDAILQYTWSGFDFPWWDNAITEGTTVYVYDNGQFGFDTSIYSWSGDVTALNGVSLLGWDLGGTHNYACLDQGTSPNKYNIFRYNSSGSGQLQADLVFFENGTIEIRYGTLDDEVNTFFSGITAGDGQEYLMSLINFSVYTNKTFIYTRTAFNRMSTSASSQPFYTNISEHPYQVDLNDTDQVQVIFQVNASANNGSRNFAVIAQSQNYSRYYDNSTPYLVTIEQNDLTVTLNDPDANGVYGGGTEVNFSCTASAVVIADAVKNITLYVYNATDDNLLVWNSTLFDATSVQANFSQYIPGYAPDLYWTCMAKDSYGEIFYASENRTLTNNSRILFEVLYPPNNTVARTDTIYNVTLNLTCIYYDCGLFNVTPVMSSAGTLDFTKTDYGSEEDCITSNVCITRGDQQGLFNSVVEPDWDTNAPNGPSDTEWYEGTCGPNPSSHTYDKWVFIMAGTPPASVGNDYCVHLITDDLYLDFHINSWTQEANGGGFSYTRTALASRSPINSTTSPLKTNMTPLPAQLDLNLSDNFLLTLYFNATTDGETYTYWIETNRSSAFNFHTGAYTQNSTTTTLSVTHASPPDEAFYDTLNIDFSCNVTDLGVIGNSITNVTIKLTITVTVRTSQKTHQRSPQQTFRQT